MKKATVPGGFNILKYNNLISGLPHRKHQQRLP